MNPSATRLPETVGEYKTANAAPDIRFGLKPDRFCPSRDWQSTVMQSSAATHAFKKKSILFSSSYSVSALFYGGLCTATPIGLSID